MLTFLISVRVNDSAPSLGTHYRGGWVRGKQRGREGEREREREMESVKSRTTEIQPAVFILSFFSFGLTLNPISLIPPLSIAFFFFSFFSALFLLFFYFSFTNHFCFFFSTH